MKMFNFERLSVSPLEDHKKDQSEEESYIETEDGLLDPLEAGHNEADRLIEEKQIADITEKEEAKKAEQRLRDMEEDREELEKTFRRF